MSKLQKQKFCPSCQSMRPENTVRLYVPNNGKTTTMVVRCDRCWDSRASVLKKVKDGKG